MPHLDRSNNFLYVTDRLYPILFPLCYRFAHNFFFFQPRPLGQRFFFSYQIRVYRYYHFFFFARVCLSRNFQFLDFLKKRVDRLCRQMLCAKSPRKTLRFQFFFRTIYLHSQNTKRTHLSIQ